MREVGHYSLFIISCEKSIDEKTSLVYEKRTQKANKRGWRLGFTPIMNQYAGSFSQVGGDEKLIM